MSQTTFEDDDLFGEAANEMRADVEDSLAAARAELPAADDVWTVDGDNALGVLNALRSALDAEDAREHLHEAKKWYTMGERADAFEDAEDLADEMEAIESLLADLEEAREGVGDVAAMLPQVRGALQDAAEAGEADGGGADADAGAEEDDAGDADVEAETDAEAEA